MWSESRLRRTWWEISRVQISDYDSFRILFNMSNCIFCRNTSAGSLVLAGAPCSRTWWRSLSASVKVEIKHWIEIGEYSTKHYKTGDYSGKLEITMHDIFQMWQFDIYIVAPVHQAHPPTLRFLVAYQLACPVQNKEKLHVTWPQICLPKEGHPPYVCFMAWPQWPPISSGSQSFMKARPQHRKSYKRSTCAR